MLALIVKPLLSAIRLAIKRMGGSGIRISLMTKDNIGPLMSDNISVAMIELLGILRM